MNERAIAMFSALMFVFAAGVAVHRTPSRSGLTRSTRALTFRVAARAQTSACLAQCHGADGACATRCM